MELFVSTNHLIAAEPIGIRAARPSRPGDEEDQGPEPFPILSVVKGRAGAGAAPVAMAPARVRLVVTVGRARGQAVPIVGPRFVIGRDPSCQLRPRSPTISRYHTALEIQDGRVYVRDLGGKNGTVLDGRSLRGEVAEAADGTRLRVGPLRFIVRIDTETRGQDAGGSIHPRAAVPPLTETPAEVHEDWLTSLLSDDDVADPRAATLLEAGPAPTPPAAEEPWSGDESWLASVFSPDHDATPAAEDDRDDRPAPASSVELDEGWLASIVANDDGDGDADPDAAIPLADVDESWLTSAFLPVDAVSVAPAPLAAMAEPAEEVDADWLASLLSDHDGADADPRAATLLEVVPAPTPPAADDPWGGDAGWLASALALDDVEAVADAPSPSVSGDGEGRTDGAPVARDLDGSARRLEEWIVSTLDGVESTSMSDREPSRNGGLPTAARLHPLKDRLAHREPEDLGQTRLRVIESRGVTVVLLLHHEILTEKDSEETEDELRNLVAAGLTCLILDFDQVERCSSQFLGTVARLSETCKAEGGLLKACSLRPALIELIAFSRLTRSIRVDPDQPTAFASAWPDRPASTLVVEVLSAVKGLGGPRVAGPAGTSRRPLAPAPVQPRLLVATGRAQGQLIPIVGSRFVIGRDPSCQLRPRSPTISRYHTALEVQDGRVYVRDLGGANGTVLDGRSLRGEVAEAVDGARLRVGPLRFVVRTAPEADDLVAHWVSEGDGPGQDEGGRPGPRAAVPAEPDPDTDPDTDASMTEVETGVADVDCKVIQGILVVTVKLPSLADESSVGQLRDALTRVSERTPIRRVVLSLCNVAILSRPAMGMLVAHMIRLEWEGGGLRLCHILNPVMAVLKKVHLPLLVETYTSLDDAVLTAWSRGACG